MTVSIKLDKVGSFAQYGVYLNGTLHTRRWSEQFALAEAHRLAAKLRQAGASSVNIINASKPKLKAA